VKKTFQLFLATACFLSISSFRTSDTNNNDSKALKLNPLKTELEKPKPQKETFTIFLPIGGFTPGFMYCGFDGDKSKLNEMTNEGWQILGFNSQKFETKKRNGETVSCNGNLYILERYR